LCARKMPFASGHFPHDRTALESGERAGTDGATPNRPERDLTGIPVPDTTGLNEHSLADDFDLGLKARGPSTSRFNARLNPVTLQYATKGLAGRRGFGLHLLVRTRYGPGAAPELQSENEFLHG